MRRTLSILAATIFFSAGLAVVTGVFGPSPSAVSNAAQGQQWEYLVVAGGTVNLNPSDSATLRKSPSGAFREAFPLEQNLDKLGAVGWELVTVAGSPGDPTFYFKRRK